MKKAKKIISFRILTTVLLLFIIELTYSQSPTNKDQSKILFLKKFYLEYVNAFQKVGGPITATDLVIKNYCSKTLIIKINKLFKSGKLDYDPFLHAQDVGSDWPSVFSYKKDSKISDQFKVSYLDPDSKKRESINLIVKEVDGKLVINDVY